MASSIYVDIVSAEGEIYSGAAAMVFVPAAADVYDTPTRHY